MSGGITIKMTKLPDVKKIQKDCEKALEYAVKDTLRSAPGKTADTVTEDYNIKKKEVIDHIRAIKSESAEDVSGIPVSVAALKVKGSPIAPSAGEKKMFNLTPTTRPEGRKKYTVRAKIKKDKVALGSRVFVAENGHGSVLPFQRKGDARLPIKSIKTVSVPQMVDNEAVREKVVAIIQERLAESIDKRLGKIYEKHGL